MKPGHVSQNSQSGATLIEVLVAFVILTFGLLGLSAIQVTALKNNVSSVQRSEASMLAHYMMDAMRANRQAAADGDYESSTVAINNPVAGCPATRICEPPGSTSADPLALQDIDDWMRRLQASFGDAITTSGFINCQPVGATDLTNCVVRVYWADGSRLAAGTQDTNPANFFIQVEGIL